MNLHVTSSGRTATHALPKTASGVPTGFAGLVAAALVGWFVHDLPHEAYVKALLVAVAAALAMAMADLMIYRPLGRGSSGLRAGPANAFDLGRVFQKLVGFWGTIGLLGCIYLVLPEYSHDFYAPARQAFWSVLPIVAVCAPFYVVLVDRYQVDPDDSYAEAGRLFLGRKPDDWANLKTHFLGWLVKGFFLPLMFIFLTNNLVDLWSKPLAESVFDTRVLYELAYSAVFVWDVLIAVVGYALTSRLLDNHIRSVEPTVLGWVSCLICYPPFWQKVSADYFNYNLDDYYWGHAFEGSPVLYAAWAALIIFFLGIYVLSTAAFGLRFSNLTHRGIITSGPYRWVKHPAYTSKLITYCMISLPFLPMAGWGVAIQSTLLLMGVAGIYVLRAITEERHLARDPDYREYQAYIAEHGLWARFKRIVGVHRGSAARTASGAADE